MFSLQRGCGPAVDDVAVGGVFDVELNRASYRAAREAEEAAEEAYLETTAERLSVNLSLSESPPEDAEWSRAFRRWVEGLP